MATFGSSSSGSTTSTEQTGNNGVALATLTTLFFMWGFITCLNDILIPYLRGVFELTIFQSTLVQFAFFGAYFIGSLIYFIISSRSGDPISKIGYKNGIIIGLITSAVGCLLFFPAAQFELYGFFLSALFVLGLGLTLLQIAANPYVALLGKPETASSRLNMAQGFNSFGTTIAPIIGGYLIFEYFAGPDVEGADAVKVPYIGLAAGFLLLAVLIWQIKLPKFTSEESIPKDPGALKYPHLVKGMLAIFCYVGAEVTIGSLLINFFELDEIMGFDEAHGSKYLSFYWGGAMIGRFLGAIALSQNMPAIKKWGLMVVVLLAAYALIFSVSRIGLEDSLPYLGFAFLNLVFFALGKGVPGRTLGLFAFGSIILLMPTIFLSGSTAMWCVIAIGLFNSIMWSNIFTLSIDGLGKYTSQGSSLLVMAILGGALIPPIQGLVAGIDGIGLQYSFFIPVLCYLYIVYYGFKGSIPKIPKP